jgi:pyruvate ferredoxin oxidoreductase beta subunit
VAGRDERLDHALASRCRDLLLALYKVKDGKWAINCDPKEKKPVSEWLKPQGGFRPLFEPCNEALFSQFQKLGDEWDRVKMLRKMSKS